MELLKCYSKERQSYRWKEEFLLAKLSNIKKICCHLQDCFFLFVIHVFIKLFLIKISNSSDFIHTCIKQRTGKPLRTDPSQRHSQSQKQYLIRHEQDFRLVNQYLHIREDPDATLPPSPADNLEIIYSRTTAPLLPHPLTLPHPLIPLRKHAKSYPRCPRCPLLIIEQVSGLRLIQ